jgi:hypothetical protein
MKEQRGHFWATFLYDGPSVPRPTAPFKKKTLATTYNWSHGAAEAQIRRRRQVPLLENDAAFLQTHMHNLKVVTVIYKLQDFTNFYKKPL